MDRRNLPVAAIIIKPDATFLLGGNSFGSRYGNPRWLNQQIFVDLSATDLGLAWMFAEIPRPGQAGVTRCFRERHFALILSIVRTTKTTDRAA